MIGGIAKYFRFSFHEILWEISWANLLMLSATIPKFDEDGNPEEPIQDIDGSGLAAFFGM